MWSSSFVACLVVAVVGAIAMNQLPAQPRHNSVFGIPPQRVGDDDEHRMPCQFPPYFTFDQVDISTSAYEGSLLVAYANFEGAYDDIAKLFAAKAFVDYFNGTEYTAKLIEDYSEGKRFIIHYKEGNVVCMVVDIEGQRFPEEYFIPADATYLKSATIGDRDVVVDSWLESIMDGTVHIVKTVTRGECVPVGIFRRHFHPVTGEQIQVKESRLYNFNLGICDPDDYFKIPEECKQGKALTKPDEVMQKLLEKLSM